MSSAISSVDEAAPAAPSALPELERDLFSLFAEQAAARPQAPAVEWEGRELGYGELRERAAALALHLRELGVGPESRVGLAVRDPETMVVATLAIVAAGGAYVPLDPAYPAERKRFILTDSGASLLLTDGGAVEGAEAVPHIALPLPPATPLGAPADPPAGRLGGDALAYIIYTSGSTGAPKGVAVPQRAVVRLVRDTDYAQLGPDDRVAQASNPAFDAATFEIWGVLLNGGCLVAFDRSRELAPSLLARELAERRVTTLFLTTALFNQVAREAPRAFAALRHLLAGGETADPAAMRRVLATAAPARLLHVYGPTEATTFSLCGPVESVPEGAATVPIGRPIAHSTAHVLGPDLAPVAAGEAGELFLGGLGLARGYWGQAELTAWRFVPAPHGEGVGGRLYRTGDRVRQLADGRIDFVGRIDRQIKLRGFRIEPGEIEAALLAEPGVQEAVVDVVRVENDGSGDRRLVAWVVLAEDSSAGGGRAAAAALRAALALHLPEPMVPAAIVALERLPLNANGKVDRAALPAPRWEEEAEDYAAPRTPFEELLTGAFADVLGLARVGIDDDFFAVGGHSLLGIQLVSRLEEEHDLELSLMDLFEEPTVAGLAQRLATAEAGRAVTAAPLVAVPRGGELPLSFAQEQIWLLDQLQGGVSYNVPFVIALRGPFVPAALAAALTELCRRHESLRTRFPAREGEAAQVIEPPAPLALPEVDLAALPEGPRRREIGRLERDEAGRPFDLARGPLLRATLLSWGPTAGELLVNIHHIVFDGTSLTRVHEELAALHGTGATGRPPALAAPALQMVDFAAWQRRSVAGAEGAADLAYWENQLAGLEPLTLPADRPRGIPRVGTLAWPLPAALARLLPAATRQARTTPFMTFAAGLTALLSRLGRSDNVAVGTPVSLRQAAELAGVVGFLVNTVVLRLDLTGKPGFAELLSRVRKTALAAYRHQRAPFETLVAALHPERSVGANPLFQVAVSHNPVPPELDSAGVAMTLTKLPLAEAKFDLALEIYGDGDDLTAVWEYRADLFDRSTVARFAEGFENLLRAAAGEPDRPLSLLPLLCAAAAHQLAVEWNDAAAEYPGEATIPALFAEQAARRPDAVALVGPAGWLTYGEVDARSAALAARLLALSVEPEERIGVLAPRSPELVVAFLGILRAGAAYLPLDPSHPEERLAGMLAYGGARILLAEGEAAGIDVAGLTVLRLDGLAASEREPSPLSADQPGPLRERGTCSDRLAYVIFTSGSTGRPKGVAVSHRAVIRLVLGSDYVALGAEDRIAQLSNASFDAATFEIWGSLLNGGRLVFLGREEALTPELFKAALEREGISALFLTTALFHWIATAEPAAFESVGTVLFGGEAVDPSRVAEVLAAGAPGRLLHVYGPTENTTFSSWHRLEGVPPGAWNLPIGGPLANSLVFLLEPSLAPAPIGMTGELYVGGEGLARGYAGRPELTAERFVPCPPGLGAAPGARLYKTGDLARQLPSGAVEFLGRADAQVKIRGFRIEPAEIEAALGTHPAIGECIVVAARKPAGELALFAYVVARPGRGVRVEELRRHLAGKLPDYMVPAGFAFLPELPRNPNGKIDRQRLPPPSFSADAAGAERGPQSPTEARLLPLWAEALERRIGVDDDFFAAGGHSLLATRLMARVRGLFAVELPLSALFEAPTVARLGERIDGALGTAEAAGLPWPPAPAAPPFPASPAQRGLWFLARVAPDEPFLNVLVALELTGNLDAAALAASLAAIAARHEPLRTTFALASGQPVLCTAPPAPRPLPVADLTALPASRRASVARSLAVGWAEVPFDLEQGPVARALLVRSAGGEHLLAFAVHHLAFDGWSIGVFYRELEAAYRGEALPPLPLRFADFAAWQGEMVASGALAPQRAFWRETLAGLPRLELPADRPRRERPSFRGGWATARLPQAICVRLEETARRSGATPFMVLLAAYQIFLARISGQSDFGIGSPVTGRNRAETQGLLGFFVNLAVLRADLSGRPTFAQVLARVRRAALAAYAHADLPFEALVEELQPERDAGGTPLFQAALSLEQPPALPALPGLAARALELEAGTAHFDLTLVAIQDAAGFEIELNHRCDLFDAPTGGRWLAGFLALLDAATAECDRPAAELPAWTAAERHQVLAEWNDAGDALAPAARIEAWVERQVDAAPGRLALDAPDGRLTYGELEARANRLAGRLARLGVGAGGRVAVAFEPGADLAVAAFATLKLGAAYLPLDPQAPPRRLGELAAEARVRAVLTTAARAAAFAAPDGGATAAILRLDDAGFWEGPDDRPDPTARGTGGNDLAYLLYTSGSTGRPKGVEVGHAGLINLVAWTIASWGVAAGDRASWVTNPAFDVSVWELWTWLAAGASLHIPPRQLLLQPAELYAWMATERIDHAFLATPVAERLLGAEPPEELPLRTLATGGDRLRVRPPAAARFRLWNVYGPTEATVVVTTAVVAPAAGGEGAHRPPSIGRPIPGIATFVLDGELRPVPLGTPGDLYLGGVGLARGYAFRPEITALRFVPHPESAAPGERLYLTGDRARLLPDGEIDFLGRDDGQVKVRGFRVELGEIEAVLTGHPAVAEAAVLVRGAGEPAADLAAFWVPREGAPTADGELRQFLRERLPAYMVPASFTALPALPLTSRGKLDRSALAKLMERAAPAPAPSGAPRAGDGLAAIIAGLWCEVLRLPEVGDDDNFFDLGGHSLALVAVHEKLEAALATRFPLVDLLENTTVRSLAAHLAGKVSTPAPAADAPERGARAALQRTPSVWGERARQARRKAEGPR